MKSFPSRWISLGLLILLNVLVYGNAINNEFVYDDTAVVVENKWIRDIKNLTGLFSKEYFARSGVGQMTNSGEGSYRPVVTLSYFLDYALWKDSSWGYHAGNLIGHILAVVLWVILVLLLFNDFPLALISGLLVSVHPVMTEAVNAVAFREDILCAVFTILAFLWGLRSLRGSSLIKEVLSGMAFLFALLAKEMAFFFPVMFWMGAALLNDSPERSKKRSFRFRLHAIHGLALGLYVMLRFVLITNPNAKDISYLGGSVLTSIGTTVLIWFGYIRLWIWPSPLCVDYSIAPLTHMMSFDFLGKCFFLGAIIVFALRAWRRRESWSFAAIWMFWCLIPVSNLIPIKNVMAERYLYLPTFGFSLLGAMGFVRLMSTKGKGFKTLAYIGLGIVLIFYSMIVIDRNNDWQNAENLWEQTVRVSPKSYNAHSNLAIVRVNQKRYDEAEAEYRKALHIDPLDPEGHYNLARCYGLMGNVAQSLAHYQESIRIDPSYAEAHNNIGIIFAEQGRFKEAIPEFEASLQINPRSSNSYHNLGNCYAELGLWAEAKASYEKALRLEPGRMNTHLNLGVLYFERREFRLALAILQKALTGAPNNVDIMRMMARCYEALGDNASCLKQWQMILQISPQDDEARAESRRLRLNPLLM